MALIIRKRISLDFLGDEYKDSYIVVRSQNLNDYEELKNSKKEVREVVIDNFIEGKIAQGSDMVDITKDNIRELSGEVFVEAFDRMMGVLNPKSPVLLMNQSSTEASPLQN